MLTHAHTLHLPHCFHIPNKRLLAILAHVALLPLRILFSLSVHVPSDDLAVFRCRDQLATICLVMNGSYAVFVTLQVVAGAFATADVPANYCLIITAREEELLLRLP